MKIKHCVLHTLLKGIRQIIAQKGYQGSFFVSGKATPHTLTDC